MDYDWCSPTPLASHVPAVPFYVLTTVANCTDAQYGLQLPLLLARLLYGILVLSHIVAAMTFGVGIVIYAFDADCACTHASMR